MKRLSSLLVVLLSSASVFSLLFAPIALASASSEHAPATAGWPSSIASTGDSITRAYNTGAVAFTDAPANSWSTGTNSAINSHYLRILASNPAISGHNFNDAVSGAHMVDLNGQMVTVNSQAVNYVTVLMGANDACTSTEAGMTDVVTFRSQFQTALNTLSAGSPDARVYVLSVPDIYNLWFILKDNSSARFAWSAFGICQSMLANPLSTAQADIDRRNRVRQRVVDFNTQLSQVCSTNIHCRFDNNTVFNTAFVPSDISTRDYFHPALAGQTRLADATYQVGFDFTDSTPPTTMLVQPESPPDTYGFAAFDPGGPRSPFDGSRVAGVEYNINNGPNTRYTGTPVTLNPGDTMRYRAVDMNGNTETWNTVTAP